MVLGSLGESTYEYNVRVALVIPAPPAPTRSSVSVRRVRATPIPTKRTAGRCTFAGTEPRVPDPVNLAVYDCETWEVAYRLVYMDRPEVLFGSFDNSVRIDMTKLAFDLLRVSTENCNTTPSEMGRLADTAGSVIEEVVHPNHESQVAPRAYILGGLTAFTGTFSQCSELVAYILDSMPE